MAESIALFFYDAQQSHLQDLLDHVAERISGRSNEWWYPKNEHNVVVYPYDDLLDEFEDEDLDELLSLFNDLPTAIICIEFQASHGMKTCDSAAELCDIIFSRFRGVVNDLYEQIWTDVEIRSGVIKESGSFHQSVRYPESVEEWEAIVQAVKSKRLR